MRQSKGKIQQSFRSRTGLIFVPSEPMIDSAFPFKVPCSVDIKIDGTRLIVQEAAKA